MSWAIALGAATIAIAALLALARAQRRLGAAARMSQSLLVGLSAASARADRISIELDHAREERDALRVAEGASRQSSEALATLETRIDLVRRDALRAAEGSSRIEERLLAFTRRIAAPEGRGAFGEDVLRNQLESLGFHEGRDFERQVQEVDGRRRIDYVLRLRGLLIAIDSKLVLDPEIGVLEDSEEPERELELGRRLVRHAKELAGRDYWRSLERSPSFVLMYVPGEGAGEALRSVPGFSPEKFATERGVFVVTPLQLGTVLGVIGELAHTARRGEEVASVSKELIELDRELGRFCDLLARESRQLGSVIGTHQALQSALGPRGGIGRIARRVRVFSRRGGGPTAFQELHPPRSGAALAKFYEGRAGDDKDEVDHAVGGRSQSRDEGSL